MSNKKNNKSKKDKMDPNVRSFFEEMENRKKAEAEEEIQKDENVELCPGCGESVVKGKRACPKCGIKLKSAYYTPISDKTAAKIRWISGTILVILFFIIWIFVMN